MQSIFDQRLLFRRIVLEFYWFQDVLKSRPSDTAMLTAAITCLHLHLGRIQNADGADGHSIVNQCSYNHNIEEMLGIEHHLLCIRCCTAAIMLLRQRR